MEKSAIAADTMVADTEAEDFCAAKHVAALGLNLCGWAAATPKSAPPITVKQVGELDRPLWAQVWAQVFPVHDPAEESAAAHKRAQMTAIWEDFLLRKQTWSGVVAALRKGQHAHGRRKDSKRFVCTGEEILAAVAAVTREVEEMVAGAGPGRGAGRCVTPHFKAWNRKEDREATLAEATQFLHAVLDDQEERMEKLFEMVQAQNHKFAARRRASGDAGASAAEADCIVKHLYFRAQEDEEAWERNGERQPEPPWLGIEWIAPVRFSEAERPAFLRARADKTANLAGTAAELHQARGAGFQALLTHGSPWAIGCRELGYLGYDTEDEVAEDYSDIVVRYQLVEFPYRVQPSPGTSRYPLPQGYVEELRAMVGIKTYASPEAATRAIDRYKTATNPCPLCRRMEPDGCSSTVLYCRDCLAPQSWNYKHHRRAGVAETLAFIVGAIFYKQRHIAIIDFAVRVQMGGPDAAKAK